MIGLGSDKNWPVSGASVPKRAKTIKTRSKKSISCYKLYCNYFVVGMWTVNHSMISADLTNYFWLPKKLESVQASSMADQVTWSPIMSSFFAIFPVDWIGHHLRPCCCHHHHGNDHCHPWRLLMRHVKTLLVNISISKFLNISVSQSGRYHNKIATKYLTTKYPNKIAICH